MIQLENYFMYVSGEDLYERTGKELKVDLSKFSSFADLYEFCNDLFQFSGLDESLVFTAVDCPFVIFPEFDRFLNPNEVRKFFSFRDMAKSEQEFYLMMNGVPSDLAGRAVCVGSESDYENYIHEYYYENFGLDKIPYIVTDTIDWDDVYYEHEEENLLKKIMLYNGSFAWIE